MAAAFPVRNTFKTKLAKKQTNSQNDDHSDLVSTTQCTAAGVQKATPFADAMLKKISYFKDAAKNVHVLMSAFVSH